MKNVFHSIVFLESATKNKQVKIILDLLLCLLLSMDSAAVCEPTQHWLMAGDTLVLVKTHTSVYQICSLPNFKGR